MTPNTARTIKENKAKINVPINKTNQIDYVTVRLTKGYDSLKCVSGVVQIQVVNSEIYLNSSFMNNINVNPFDPHDPFFSNECYSFSTNQQDFPRSQRINYYFINNATFCDNQSLAIDINYTSNLVNCSCYPAIEDPGNEIEFNKTKESLFIKAKYGFIERLFCYKLVLNEAIILNNYGSWILISITGFALINLIVFLITSMNSIRSYFLIIYRKSLKENSMKPINQNCHVMSNNNSKSNRPFETVISHKNKSNLFGTSDIDSKQRFTIDNYDDMDFAELMLYDQRGFSIHYCDYFLLIHPLTKTFYTSSIKSLRTIKIAKFLTSLAACFGLNAFLYFDKYLVYNYYNPDNISVFYNWPVAVYSYLLEMVFNFLLNLLSNNRAGMKKVRKAKTNEQLETMDKFIRNYKCKLTFFFILHFIFLIMFWYNVALFCAIYPNTQFKLFSSALITFSLGQIFPFLTALFYTIIITMCINQRKICWYKILKFLTYYY